MKALRSVRPEGLLFWPGVSLAADGAGFDLKQSSSPDKA